MNHQKLSTLIGEQMDDDEALLAVQSVINYPDQNALKVRCHMSAEFTLIVSFESGLATISTPGMAPESVPENQALAALKRMIYEVDEAISCGDFTPAKPKELIISSPRPPADMDLPTWDEESQRWYDAEY